MRISVLDLCNRLGQILDLLDEKQEPVIVEEDRKPRAVLLPFALYRERFPDGAGKALRDDLVDGMRRSAPKATRDTVVELRRLRYGLEDAER